MIPQAFHKCSTLSSRMSDVDLILQRAREREGRAAAVQSSLEAKNNEDSLRTGWLI